MCGLVVERAILGHILIYHADQQCCRYFFSSLIIVAMNILKILSVKKENP